MSIQQEEPKGFLHEDIRVKTLFGLRPMPGLSSVMSYSDGAVQNFDLVKGHAIKPQSILA